MSKRIGLFFLALTLFSQTALAAVTAFLDVPSDSWYAPYVQTLTEKGVVNSGTAFRPADRVNRAELVKMVITAINGLKDYTPPPRATFDDVVKGMWFYDYVEQAATLDIVSGYSDADGNLTGYFGPGDLVTRASAAKILVQAFKLKSNSVTPDVPENDWFASYVKIASQNGVLAGYSNGRFGPDDPVTRSEMAKMITLSAEASGLWSKTPPEQAPSIPQPQTPQTPAVPVSPPTSPTPSLPPAVANPASIERENIAAGSSGVLVAKYVFRARLEGFHVQTVTIVNDVTGDKFGDQPLGTSAIKNVTLKFPNKDGKLATVSTAFGSDGTARFSNLDFFAARDTDTFFEVYADLNTVSDAGPGLSGTVIRLGLQDTGNTTDSFRAVGDITNSVVGFNTGSFQISSSQVAPFVVRRSIPHFTLNDSPAILNDGENTLYSFNVAADQAGDIGLARLVFEISVSDAGAANLAVSDFKVYRGSAFLSNASIYDATGAQNLSPGSGGKLMNGVSSVIITFPAEEIISGGNSHTYTLEATVSSSNSGDSIGIGIAPGDDDSALTGLTKSFQPNTGKIYVNGDATAGIFTGASDFFQSLGSARNILWSDQSADLHLYPTITGGVITSDSGSADWTNGYDLGLNALGDHILAR